MKSKIDIVLNDFLMNLNFSDERINDLTNIFPELKQMINFDHNHPHHHLDVFEHTLLAISKSDEDFDVRLALLFHDIGKPLTCTKGSDGVNHFYGHNEKSYEITKKALNRYCFNESYIDYISKLVKYHDYKLPIKMNKLLNLIDDNSKIFIYNLLRIQYADALAHHPDFIQKRINYLNRVLSLLSLTVNLNLGIDIDNTLTYISPEIKKEITATKSCRSDKKVVLSKDELNIVYNKVVTKACPREFAVEAINQLKEEGNRIIIITSRNEDQYKDPYKISEKWLIRNKIYYDKLIVDAKDKVDICLEEKIDIHIDDNNFVCFKLNNAGITTIKMLRPNTKYLGENECDDWNSAYQKVNKIKKEGMFKYINENR